MMRQQHIALNRAQLSRLSHHWFWGIQVDVDVKPTLADRVDELLATSSKVVSVMSDIERVDGWSWWVRQIYWLCNIGGYREKYYVFHSYLAFQAYMQGLSRLSESDKQRVIAASGFVWVGMLFLSMHMQVIWRFNQGWFTNKVQSMMQVKFPLFEEHHFLNDLAETSSQNEASSKVDEDSDETLGRVNEVERVYRVSQKMIGWLLCLGIVAKVGEAMSLRRIKQAYREKVLVTHPDKTRTDTKVAFQGVNEAMAELLRCMKEMDGLDLIYESHAGRAQDMQDIMALSKHVEAQMYHVLKKQDECIAEVEECLVESRQCLLESRQCLLESQKINLRTKKYIQEVDKFVGKVNDLMARMRLMNQRSDDILDAFEAYLDRFEKPTVQALPMLPWYDAIVENQGQLQACDTKKGQVERRSVLSPSCLMGGSNVTFFDRRQVSSHAGGGSVSHLASSW